MFSWRPTDASPAITSRLLDGSGSRRCIPRSTCFAGNGVDKRELLVQVATSLPSAEDTVIERERRADVRRVLRRLPRRSAAVLVMRHGGMSYAEIAAALGVRVGHVGTLRSTPEQRSHD